MYDDIVVTPWIKRLINTTCTDIVDLILLLQYSELSLQWQDLFAKVLPLKLILKEICLFFLLSSQNTCFDYLLELPHWGDSKAYPYIFLEVFNTILLYIYTFLINLKHFSEAFVPIKIIL